MESDRLQIRIADRLIGGDARPLVIAEAGVNHNGSVEMAERLVDAAADAGADAVKFQTFIADSLVVPEAPRAAYQTAQIGSGSQLEMLRWLQLPADSLAALRSRAMARGLIFLSTPFDLASLHLLVELGVPAVKIGSGDLTNLILLRAAAAHGLPLLVSTGMATLDEISLAVADLQAHGDPPLVLLQCTSAYPAPVGDANLRAMATLEQQFGVPVGYSDHTLGIATAIAASALGAGVVEKHITLDRSLAGPDHAASLTPDEFLVMVGGIHDASDARGDGAKTVRPAEEDTRRVARRSLVLRRERAAGEQITADDVDAKRPASGISPLRLDEVLGRRAARDLVAQTILQADDLEPPLGD